MNDLAEILNIFIHFFFTISLVSFSFRILRSLFKPFGIFDPFIGFLGKPSESEKEKAEVIISEDKSGE